MAESPLEKEEGHHLSIKCKKLKNKNGRCHFFATKIEMHTFILCYKNNDAEKKHRTTSHDGVIMYRAFGLVEPKNSEHRTFKIYFFTSRKKTKH